MTSIEIPESVRSIGLYTFEDCKNLTNITIPANVTSIEYDSFEGCDNLSSIKILKSKGSISGSPWGAPNENLVVEWND